MHELMFQAGVKGMSERNIPCKYYSNKHIFCSLVPRPYPTEDRDQIRVCHFTFLKAWSDKSFRFADSAIVMHVLHTGKHKKVLHVASGLYRVLLYNIFIV